MQVSVKKKSNSEVTLPDVVAELPELVKRTPPTPEPKAEIKVETKAEPKIEAPKAAAPKVEMPKPAPKVATKRPSILNLGALLSQDEEPTKSTQAATTTGAAEPTTNIDPQAHQKLESARGAILKYLGEWRPRFIAVFEPMTFEGNVIKISVPTTELRDEIMRNKTEFLTRVLQIADIKGIVELDIEVNESIRSIKPIKLEDRIAHIMAMNPLIAELQAALDLDVEG